MVKGIELHKNSIRLRYDGKGVEDGGQEKKGPHDKALYLFNVAEIDRQNA